MKAAKCQDYPAPRKPQSDAGSAGKHHAAAVADQCRTSVMSSGANSDRAPSYPVNPGLQADNAAMAQDEIRVISA
ncbi:MAG: hypothetical protein IPI17_16930 [Nitrosomonas sp.]|nr:hypothetical protein [Nitrosomonas sp.]